MKKRSNKQNYKRLLTLLIVTILLFTNVDITAFATQDSNNMDTETWLEENESLDESIAGSSFEVDGSESSLGRALLSTVPIEVETQDTGFSSNIREIVVNDNQAKVVYYAPVTQGHTLVVGIYDETGKKQLAVGSYLTIEGQQEVMVTLSASVPQYFLVKGYIIETDTLRPLCDVYESDDYTQTMQEFYNKTINDFNIDQVVNFDESENNNFIVFNDGVKVVRQTEDGITNELVEADENNHIYKIANPNDSVSALTVGDVFVYSGNDNKIIITEITEIIQSSTESEPSNDVIIDTEVETEESSEAGTDESLEEENTEVETVSGNSPISEADTLIDTEISTDMMTVSENDLPSEESDLSDEEVVVSGETDTVSENDLTVLEDFAEAATQEENNEDTEEEVSQTTIVEIHGQEANPEELFKFIKIGSGNPLDENQQVSTFSTGEVEKEQVLKLAISNEGITIDCIGITCAQVTLSWDEIDDNDIMQKLMRVQEFKDAIDDFKKMEDNGESFSVAFTVNAGVDAFINLSSEDNPKEAKVEVLYDVTFSADYSLSESEDIWGDSDPEPKLLKMPELAAKIPMLAGIPENIITVKAVFCFQVEVEAQLFVEVTASGSMGGYVNLSSKEFKSNVVKPEWEFKFGLKGTITPQFVAKIEAGLFENEKKKEDKWALLSFEYGATIGAQIEVPFSIIEGDENGKRHLCGVNEPHLGLLGWKCLEASMTPVANTSGKIVFIGIEFEIEEKEIEILMDVFSCLEQEMYYSFTFEDFGWTKCPYRMYASNNNVKIQVKDGPPLAGATVISAMEEKVTDENGETSITFPEGSQNIYIKSLGRIFSKSINIPEDIKDGQLTIEVSDTDCMQLSTAVKNIYTSKEKDDVHNTTTYAVLTKDGSLYMWGSNEYGLLGIGDNSEEVEETPTSIVEEPLDIPIKVLDNVKEFQFSPDGMTCAAITKDDNLYMWGFNGDARIGMGKIGGYVNKPHKVSINVKEFQFSPDSRICSMIQNNDTLWMWGYNGNDIIHNLDSALYVVSPIEVMDKVEEFDFYDRNNTGLFCFALCEGGQLRIWGCNYNNQLGSYNNRYDSADDWIAGNIAETISESIEKYYVDPYRYNSACITQDGKLYMWGEQYSGYQYLEDGSSEWHRLVEIEFENNLKIKDFYINNGVYFAVMEDGSLYQWGYDVDWKTFSKEPVQVDGIDGKVESVFLEDGTCAAPYAVLTEDNKLYMWGNNYYGQLGTGDTTKSAVPLEVLPDVEFKEFVFIGSGHSCAAITKQDELYLWGSLEWGQESGTIIEPEKVLENVEHIILYPDEYFKWPGTGYSYKARIVVTLIDSNDIYTFYGSEDYVQQEMEEKVQDSLCLLRLTGSSYYTEYNDYELDLGVNGNIFTRNLGVKPQQKYLFGSYEIVKNRFKYVEASAVGLDCGVTTLNKDTVINMLETEQEDVSAEKSKHFEGLLPDSCYNVYALKDKNIDNNLETENVLYIGQFVSDSSGEISIDFEMREAYADPDIFCVPYLKTDLSSAQVEVEDIVYDGLAHMPRITVVFEGNKLIEGQDYRLQPEFFVTEVGEYQVTIKGTDLYYGEKTVTFCVKKDPLAEEETDIEEEIDTEEETGTEESTTEEESGTDNPPADKPGDGSDDIPEDAPGDVIAEDIPESGVEAIPEGLWVAGVDKDGYSYTGSAIKPVVRVYDHKTLLTEKKDYTISYKNNKKAYTFVEGEIGYNSKKVPTITVKGKGNYSGTEKITFKILPLDITGEDFIIDNLTTPYNSKKVQKLVPTVLWKNKKLKNKTDFKVTYPDAEKDGAYKEPGTYNIQVEGYGNYTGKKTITLEIVKTISMSKVTVKNLKNQEYTGSPIEPSFVVKYGKDTLEKDVDYTVAYEKNTDVGTGYVVLTGKGDYTGQKRVAFKITGWKMNQAKVVSGLPKSVDYDGTAHTPECTLQITVKGVTKTLNKDIDYTVSYDKNTSAGTAAVIFTGKGGYSGTLKKTFKINKFNVTKDVNNLFTVEEGISAVYRKGGSKPKPVVKYNGTVLTEGVDYTLSYKNNKAVHDGVSSGKIPTVTVKGKGSFNGSKSVSFAITGQDIGKLVMNVADKVFSTKKNGFKSTPKVYDLDGKLLKAGTDYKKTVEYTYKSETTLANGTVRNAGAEVDSMDIVPEGTIILVTVYGDKNYSEKLTGEYEILKKGTDLSKASISITPQEYTGKAIKLDKTDVKVNLNGGYLDPVNFEIVDDSYKNNVKKGKASVTIRGIGEYGGCKTVKFTIKAKKFEWWKALMEQLFN